MHWTLFLALVLIVPTVALAQEPAQGRSPQPRNQLPSPTAEPENAASYAPPEPMEEAGPSAADRGPAQRPFVLVSETDNLALEDNPPTVSNAPPEKIALDKHIRIPLIHDVQDDATYKGGSNHALLFEIKYINWGAVTQEQLEARRGHYFTITWANNGPRADFVARFQYREVKSMEIVRSLEEPMHNIKGTVRSYFAVVGKAYHTYGPVS
jgi:hypothetical protein